MPLGIQLIAPFGCDAALFQCAEWVTRALQFGPGPGR
jgi:Asp-tRNA(Asn)/Glu-tRNA(Gln) amidotransferase A subunit family amidase